MGATGRFADALFQRLLGLLGLGLSMEVGQYLMRAGRMADTYDMAANAAGVLTGLLLASVLTGGWAQRVESWLT